MQVEGSYGKMAGRSEGLCVQLLTLLMEGRAGHSICCPWEDLHQHPSLPSSLGQGSDGAAAPAKVLFCPGSFICVCSGLQGEVIDGQFAGSFSALFPEKGQCPEASTPLRSLACLFED